MKSKSNNSEIPNDKLALYDMLIESNPEIERKGKSMPYTSYNGHMFTHLDKEGTLGIRLSDKDKQAFEKKYGISPFVQFGVVLKEYVAVPDELLRNTKVLKKYLDASFEYIKTLKPKATTKTKKVVKK